MKITNKRHALTTRPESHNPECSSNSRRQSMGRKRIGPYSYKVTDCIGSGFSSQVFRGFHCDRTEEVFAIKVIGLLDLNKAKRELLRNEIKILQQLDNPNIIKFHDVYYTENNCYIMTEFCEGGTLQNHIESNPSIDWREVAHQLVNGLSYLSSRLITHRDIKPANIFLKGDVWKIGDLGFARYLESRETQVQEMYMVGSPLYMPPETLEKKIYSLKTDSFALGILLFHLVTRQFPWSGNSKKEFLESYTNKKYPSEKIAHLPEHYQKFLKGLCEIEISRRMYIADFEHLRKEGEKKCEDCSEIETVEELPEPINEADSFDNHQTCLQLPFVVRIQQKFDGLIFSNADKIALCKFVHFIDNNIQHFSDMCALSESLRRVLKALGLCFKWDESKYFSKYLDEFKCRNYQQIHRNAEIVSIQSVINSKISSLEGSGIARCLVLKKKLGQLGKLLHALAFQRVEDVKAEMKGVVLHPDFSKVRL